MNTPETKANSCAVSVPTRAEIMKVFNELHAWANDKQGAAKDAADRSLMSLAFCAHNNGMGQRELAEDVEALRQARFGYP